MKMQDKNIFVAPEAYSNKNKFKGLKRSVRDLEGKAR